MSRVAPDRRTLVRVASAVLALGLLAPVRAQEYPGDKVPGTETFIAVGDPVLASPQRGYVKYQPKKKGGPSPWNCLAHAKGKRDIWIEPGAGARRKPGGSVVQPATMAQILADNDCAIVPCADPPEATRCPPPTQLVWLLYETPKGSPAPAPAALPDDDYWYHAMRQTPDGTWTSKDGVQAQHDNIRDPYAVLPFYPIMRLLIRCACCPIPPGTGPATSTTLVPTTSSTTTAPDSTVVVSSTTVTTTTSATTTTDPRLSQAVRLDSPLGPSLPAGSVVCLDRIVGGYEVEGHGPGCDSLHLHGIPGLGIIVLVGGAQEGPFLDPNPNGCGYGRIVAAPCPAIR